MNNPIDNLRNDSSIRNPFSDYSDKGTIPMPIKLSNFYEAESKLLNYNQAVTLYGIRRTGKTVVLEQLWDKYKTNKSIYLYINEGCNIIEIIDLISYKDIDYLFIDEVTRIVNMDVNIHELLDLCASKKIKLVISGTDSYLISLSTRDSALGRLNLVRFLPIKYSDIKLLYDISFIDYCDKGVSLANNDVVDDLIFTVSNSIEKSFMASKNPIYRMKINEYRLALQTVIEYVISVVQNKIKPPKYELHFPEYIIDDKELLNKSSLTSSEVNEFYYILRQIDVIKVIPRIIVGGESEAVFYLSLPAFYSDLIYNATNYNNSNNLGVSGLLFEATAVTQIISILNSKNVWCRIYSIRGIGGEYEIDLCIETSLGDGEWCISLIEFKGSQSKYAKYFDHPKILKHCSNFSKINRYTVYAVKSKSPKDIDNKIYIEDFLENLLDYIY